MKAHHITLAATKLARFTDVLWQDLLLNAAFFLGILGVAVWVVWWWQERKRGIRGAAKKPRLTVGRSMRNRRVFAGLSMAGALVHLGFGIPLAARGDDDGSFLLVFGGLIALAWLIVLPLCRPLPRPADDRLIRHAPTRNKPYDQVSYENLPAEVPAKKRNR